MNGALKSMVIGLFVGVVAFGSPPGVATSQTAPSTTDVPTQPYSGPKARIAVTDFQDKMSGAGQYRVEFGRGLSDMLVTALFQTNRFIILEREKLRAVTGELGLQQSDLFRRETGVPLGELEGAELLIAAAVTGFEPGVSGGGGTLGSLFGLGRVLGAIGAGFTKSRVAADLRVIDVRTGHIVSATNVEGSATSFSGSLSGIGGAMGGALGGFAKTPMETAIREMIQKMVEFMVARTPETYYRHGSPDPSAAGSLLTAAPARLVPASAPPAGGETILKSVRADLDRDLVVSLNEVKVRGAVLSVVVSLALTGGKAESEQIELAAEKSHILDYNTAQMYPLINVDGFSSGRLKPGEVKILRATFRAPAKDATAVGITLSGVGTFDDVKIEP